MDRRPRGKRQRRRAQVGGRPARIGRILRAASLAAALVLVSFAATSESTIARSVSQAGKRVTIFDDGFESGHFSNWSVVHLGGDGTVAVQSSVVAEGKLAVELSETSNRGSRADLRKTFSARYSDLTASGSFRVLDQGAGLLPLFRFFDARWRQIATVYRQGQSIRVSYAGRHLLTRGTLPLNTWASVVLHVVTHGATSTVDLRLNGKSIYHTRKAHLGRTGVTTVQIGNDAAARAFTMAADAIRVQRGGFPLPSPPVNTSPPTVQITGRSVHAAAGSWSGKRPIAHRYRWLRCDPRGGHCKSIAHATKATYTIRGADIGRTVRVVVTSTNSVGAARVRSAARLVQSPPVNRRRPSIVGSARDGSVVTADRGRWTGTAPLGYAYQWLRCDARGANCAPIPGAAGIGYQVGTADLAGTLRVEVTASNGAGTAKATSAAIRAVAAPPLNRSLPSILGTPQDGQSLSADPGSWAGTPPIEYGYQWLRCDASGANCAAISGATRATYVVAGGDVGHTLRVNVTATNAVASATARSSAVKAAASLPVNATRPSISGSAQQGQTLTAVPGSWSGTPPISYAYQWLRCDSGGANCGSISGAHSSTYKLENADAGHKLRVEVTASNSGGSSTARSSATAVVKSALSGAVALWHMDETSGSTMNDSVGGHDGTLFHVQLGLPGTSGNAYGFNGSTSYVSVPSGGNLNPGSAKVTVTIHLKSTGTPLAPPRDWDLIRKGDFAPGGAEFKMEFQQTGQASCGFEGTAGYSELVAGPAINDGNWHTVKCVKTSSAIEVVVDGHTFSQKASIGSISNSDPVVIGAHPNADYYGGSLDEASIQLG